MANSASFDDTALLEEVLDILARRGIAVSRLRVGQIELDVASVAVPVPVVAPIESLPPADPALRVHVPLDRLGPYGTGSLWPSGRPPSFGVKTE